MTENHEYHTPEKGTANWHEPLNENFRSFDTDIEIRDREENLDQYTPKEGAKFFATDAEHSGQTGRIFIGDGEEWQRITLTDEPVAYDTASVGATNGTNDLIDVEPLDDALREGYIVGVTNRYQVVVDPTEHSSDADAIQYANDELLDNFTTHEEGGRVLIPALRPDGSEFTIDRTVTFGSRSESKQILPSGWGFQSTNGPLINCTIDNGDPMFLVARGPDYNTQANAGLQSFGGFGADAGGNDAECLRLESVTRFHLANVYAKHFDNQGASGVFVFDGECYNSLIDRTAFSATQHDCSGADVWVLTNDHSGSTKPPGEIKFGPGNTTYADPSLPFNTGFRCDVSATDIAWGGRIEGAGGPAAIYQTGGELSVTGYTEIGRLEGSADGIYFDGYKFQVSPALSVKTNETNGHALHIGANAGRVSIPTLNIEKWSGDVIRVERDRGGEPQKTVPYEETIDGSVTYPSPPWWDLVYPDGWQKFRDGTTTIAANTTTTLTEWAGKRGKQIQLRNLSVQSADGDVQFQPVYGWRSDTNDGEGRQWVGIEERAGNSFDLSWVLHKRP